MNNSNWSDWLWKAAKRLLSEDWLLQTHTLLAAVIVFFKELLDLLISSKHIFWSSQQSVTRISGPTIWKNKQQMRASPEGSLWRKRSFCTLLSAEPRPHTALFSCTMALGLLVIWLHAWAVLLTVPRDDYFVAGVVLASVSFLKKIEEAKTVFFNEKASNFATSFFCPCKYYISFSSQILLNRKAYCRINY